MLLQACACCGILSAPVISWCPTYRQGDQISAFCPLGESNLRQSAASSAASPQKAPTRWQRYRAHRAQPLSSSRLGPTRRPGPKLLPAPAAAPRWCCQPWLLGRFWLLKPVARLLSPGRRVVSPKKRKVLLVHRGISVGNMKAGRPRSRVHRGLSGSLLHTCFLFNASVGPENFPQQPSSCQTSTHDQQP